MAPQMPRRHALCVRPRLNPEAAAVLNTVVNEWVDTLRLHCDVTEIAEDFDFAKVCEAIRPDIVIFDTAHWGRPQLLEISNLDRFAHIPRVLYFNCDPHDPFRPATLSMLHRYGIEAIFTMGDETIQQLRGLERHPVFILPKFIDETVFKDRGLDKTIPVSIFSAHLVPSFYPWRAQITEEIQKIIPTLLYPHPGYNNLRTDVFEVRGEAYSALISQSMFSVADTTRLDYAVRKHLEIPGSGTVLVAPNSPALHPYGFVDMENCVLGEPMDIYRKIIHLARDRAHYERVRRAGYALVHGTYTRARWTFMLDWLECRLKMALGEAVRQTRRFGPFEITPRDAASPSVAGLHLTDSPLSARLRQIRDLILDGRAEPPGAKKNLGVAGELIHEVMSWVNHTNEPIFLAGMICLLMGDMPQAKKMIAARSIMHQAADPRYTLLDPVEAAWLMLIAALTGDGALLEQMRRQSATTPHVALRRVAWLISSRGQGALPQDPTLEGPQPGDWLSMHWLGEEDFAQWRDLVRRILRANRRGAQADALESLEHRHEGAARMN
ncbi:CgeB family protein [Xanthobacter agilis]|uniref:Glycosyltransferase family 1 protein n=2 Tax=Xanthobacter agilis TaxID=47492 RepID=A0ABU0LI18_XANAG|nr:hypothetical protein [Xanthobacter agilis]